MNFTLQPLPFAEDALEPYISKRTVHIHYNKHHQGYMSKLDKALEKDERRERTLEEIMQSSDGHVFNCAAQVWNHSFYWSSIAPGDGTALRSGPLQQQIETDFGSLQSLKDKLRSAAAGQFGSGWAWLVWDKKSKLLSVTSTSDAENPLSSGHLPLLTIDVWEHAYYLDYQNERDKYLDAVIDKLINWNFASRNFDTSSA
ncbi:MAG: superoxide dismutase [Halioglobus sp.]